MMHEVDKDHAAKLAQQQAAWKQALLHIKQDQLYDEFRQEPGRAEAYRSYLALFEASMPDPDGLTTLLDLCIERNDGVLFDLLFDHFDLPEVITLCSDILVRSVSVKNKLKAKLHAPNCPVSEVQVDNPLIDPDCINILTTCEPLKFLTIRSEHKDGNNTGIINSYLSNTPALKFLHLAGNSCSSSSDIAHVLAEFLRKSKSVEILCVEDVEFDNSTPENIEAFFNKACHHPTLRRLSFLECSFNASQLSIFAKALKSNSTMQLLEMDGIIIRNEKEFCQLIEIFAGHGMTYQALAFTHRGFKPSYFSRLLDAVALNKSIIHLLLPESKFTMYSAFHSLCKLISQSTTLKSIDLGNCKFESINYINLLHQAISKSSLNEVNLEGIGHRQNLRSAGSK